MTCKSLFNLISLIPDGNTYQITANSDSGWYILHQPSNTAKPNAAIPIYHQQGDTSYLGWTTTTPVNCGGIINYPTGKCQLVAQLVEDSVNTWISAGDNNTHKTELTYSGRCVNPRITNILNSQPEHYCFYRLNGDNNLLYSDITRDTIIANNWYLGHASHREVLGSSRISERVFGSPVNTDIRAIGLYSNLLASLNLTNIREDSSIYLPTPTQLLNNSIDSANLVGKILTISLDSKVDKLYLVFSNPVAGIIGSIHTTSVTQENVLQYKIENLNNFDSISLDLNALVYPLLTSVDIVIGNQTISTLSLP